MNEVKIYVNNIVSDVPDGSGHTIVCDTNSWGICEYGVERWLSSRQYKDVMKYGYYMG